MAYRTVNVFFSVYVPDNLDIDGVIEYLNEKLHDDPEFFGELDHGCVELTNEIEN